MVQPRLVLWFQCWEETRFSAALCDLFPAGAFPVLLKLENNTYSTYSKDAEVWEDKRLLIWQSVFLLLVYSSFNTPFVSSLTDSLPHPPLYPCGWRVSSNVLSFVCVYINMRACDHLHRQHTVLQLLPSLRGLVPSITKNLPKPHRALLLVGKEKKNPVLVFCFDWGCFLFLTVPASWLSSHSHLLLPPAYHPPRLADAAIHPLTLYTSLCVPRASPNGAKD